MKFLALTLSLVLVGCASVKHSSSRNVVVMAAGGLGPATSKAEDECSKNNRRARFVTYGATKLEYLFECVESSP